MTGFKIRTAKEAEIAEIASIFDAAALQTEIESLTTAIQSGDALVAARPTGPILGAIFLAGNQITAIAVRPGRRGQEIGTVLVDACAGRHDKLLARFDPSVRPFWESVGFEVKPLSGSERLQGVRQ